MRIFFSDCYGHLLDHSGVIGTFDRPGIDYAVEILNEQQKEIERIKSVKPIKPCEACASFFVHGLNFCGECGRKVVKEE